MELIFEVTDQAGRRHQYRKLRGERLTIGRAWDNDLILTDPTVDPHHAVIEKNADGEVLIRDLNTLNGTGLYRKHGLHGSARLLPGEEYQLGRTRVCVYTPDYMVAETIPVAEMDITMRQLDNPLLLTGAILVVTFFFGGEQWLNMFSGFKWQQIANVLLVVYGSAITLTLFWVVVGRVLRHEMQFRKQLTLILIFVGVQFVVSKLFALVMFNTLNFTFSIIFLVVLEFGLLATMFWFNLYLATNQTGFQRTRTAMIIATAIIVLSLYTEISVRSEFTDIPNYVRVLAPPALHFGGAVGEDEFITRAMEVFSRLDEE